MTESELATASRETLLAFIAELRALLAASRATIAQHETTVAALQTRIRQLEERLASRGGPGMPGNKPAATRAKPPVRPRKKRARGFGRPRLVPTQTVRHAVERCPACQTRLVGGWVQRPREVIEIPLVPVPVIEHQCLARECPLCGTRRVPPADVAGVVVGKRHRLGVGVLSLIATLREEGRLPLGTIQWYLATFHQLPRSRGAVVGALRQVAARGTGAVGAIPAAIRASPVVHADETGWREKGTNGYAWTFATPTERYFRRGARTKQVVDDVLGPAFDGVLVSDFSAAYHHYPGVHQRCRAHLLRDIHDLQELSPTDPGLAGWAGEVREVYDDAVAFRGPEEARRLARQRELEGRLLRACRPFAADPLAVQAKLCRRIARHIKELFVFVGNPLVPATNNAAERSLRHRVTSRKISGGTQSEQGTTSKMTLASLSGTWRARGLNPLHACRDLLTSPDH